MKSTTVSLLSLVTACYGLNFNYGLRLGSGGRNIQDFNKLAKDVARIENMGDGHGYQPRAGKPYGYENRYIEMPIDHFHNESQYEPHSSGTFQNRYWFSDRYYKPGGPVFLLLVGEASGTLRLPILHTGITHQFIKENNALGVVMEHRYYGKSFPTPNLSTKNLRFLTTQQALADVAYLAQNVKFAGLEQYNLTSDSVPWIIYGGSYSGAMTAYLRVQYPDVFWGAISSSGVTKAIWDYWQYYDPVAQYAPSKCVTAQKQLTNVVDTIWKSGSTKMIAKLQSAFGLPNITHFSDFANQLSAGIGNWQSLEWETTIDYPGFYWYCGNISSTKALFPSTKSQQSEVKELISAGGYKPTTSLVNQMLNYIGWNNETYVVGCAASGMTQDECFTQVNKTHYEQDGLDTYNWRSWSYQYCTQWGFLQTGSGVPSNQLPLISRAITLDYLATVCRDAFGLEGAPDLELSNQYGGYDIEYDRLALIGGEWDPWRPSTPLAFGYGAKQLHHWDEFGVYEKLYTNNPKYPPQTIRTIQSEEHAFVKAWLDEWKQTKARK